MAECNPCIAEQADEILALSAIFGEDFSQEENPECGGIYEMRIKVNLVGKTVQLCAWMPTDCDNDVMDEGSEGETIEENNKKILFKRSESRQHTCLLLSVSHLTPLRLQFSYPTSYPTSAKPLYTISCQWLDVHNLNRLCSRLDELWDESLGEPIIFPWVDWIQNSSLEYLGAYECINLKPYAPEADAEWDPRALTEFIDPKSSALEILQYDFKMVQQEFRKENHTCEICFEEREGFLFYFIHECGHKFCVECLLDYCQLHVREGTVRQLLCPENKCKAMVSPMILRELLSDDDYERWEKLLFEQTLATMADVLYCPRCNTVVIQDEDGDSKLAQCRNCFYSFCTECHMTWHSTQPCAVEYSERPAEDDTKKLSKREMRRRRNKNIGTTEEDEEEEKLSYQKIKKKSTHNPVQQSYNFLLLQKRLGNYQRCPKCGIMVERISGCNMMHCSRCGQSFCWSCGGMISGYDHFSVCGQEIQRRGQEMLANRPVAEAVTRMQNLVRDDPNVKLKLKMCPRCGQKNMKEHRNNHVKCWSCKFDFCYQCGKQTGNPVMNHFSVSSNCKQHSDD